MAERKLRISAELSLPIDVAGEAMAILATRGAGKSYTSATLVEELHAAGVQVVVVDPTGVYWGLRSSADGNQGGLGLFVLGGAHGHVPLEPTAGKLIADVIVDTGQSLVLDMSDFDSKGAQTRFVADLAERLYQRKARSRTTLHLVIDEANEFAPQRPMRDEPRMLGAMERIVGKGRSRGIGITLVSQRSAAINKNVLDLIDTLLAMRTLGPRDRKAIRDWIDVKQADDEAGVVESLPSLPTGTAWVWSPVRGILQKAAIRRIRTFDSYRTPKPGETRVGPTATAELDVEALGEQMQATREKAEASDPRKLQARIRELELDLHVSEQELANRPTAETIVERVEVPVLNGQVEKLQEVVGDLRQIGEGMVMAGTGLAGVADSITAAIERVRQQPPEYPSRSLERRVTAQRAGPPPPPQERPPRPPVPPRDREVQSDGDAKPLKAGARRMLQALAQLHPNPLSRVQVGILADVTPSGGTFGDYLSSLRQGGHLVEFPDGRLALSPSGHELVVDYTGLGAPSVNELAALWGRKLKAGARRMLDVLVAVYPDGLTREELGERAGVAASGGTFGDYLSALRRLSLLDESQGDVRAGEALFMGSR